MAGFLSLVAPGLGQMYGGRWERGAAILVAAVVVGGLNVLFVVAFAAAGLGPESGWAYWVARIGHDVVALWSVVFWGWVVVDAVQGARRE